MSYSATAFFQCRLMLASYPGLLVALFVACSTNTGEGLVKLVMCNGIPGCWVDIWRSGTFTVVANVSSLVDMSLILRSRGNVPTMMRG